ISSPAASRPMRRSTAMPTSTATLLLPAVAMSVPTRPLARLSPVRMGLRFSPAPLRSIVTDGTARSSTTACASAGTSCPQKSRAPDLGPAMGEARIVTAAVLLIGNEILSGRTRDANLAYLATGLTQLGIRLREARVIADIEADVVMAVNECRARYDYVSPTGGIGPTHDDITAECVAKAFDLPLIRHPEAVARLERHYQPGMLNEARLRMANTPEGATLIDNPVSTAPGFQIGNVFVLAGVPAIMQAMFDGLK